MSEKYLVVGAGKSGVAAIDLLLRLGKDCLLYDGNKDLDITALKASHSNWDSVQIIAGDLDDSVLEACTIAVLSPGVPTDLPVVDAMRSHGLKIWGEVELAYQLGKGQVCAITGTNGKTTTTALTGEIMKTYFNSTFVVGNIGIPYTGVADQTKEDSVVVAEISSFMLETIDAFHPHVSAILNITPDHLNRHHTMENYILAKENITKNQTEKDIVILNYDDPVLREFGKTAIPRVVYFSSKEKVPGGMYVEGEKLISEFSGQREEVVSITELNIVGSHNYENALAAIAFGQAMGVPMENIRKALRSFQAVEHRIEFTAEKRGVRFYNDSKGTNPDAAIKAVDAMQWPTCLIGGGYDKQSDFDEWVSHFPGKVKKLTLIGATAKQIAASCDKIGFKDYEFCETLEEAIDHCYRAAEKGDCVLLSPACASWDMFKSYEERGEIFKDYVRKLPE
ncbi:MAG TPA: UDP-N-acetylmuramoyl-L-alanine--D-glutamate ligase [Lachnospiraceae bacterium]|nr:UDP-N-acetylmuramoyl-L-alanine--D-glutamate ligase [Lachnospiraceae bacterium]HBE08834.1 UDP-N-acetylmuramoyl-L-alanine--D-glutamate ligase [Lachnospiraceae bacterium]